MRLATLQKYLNITVEPTRAFLSSVSICGELYEEETVNLFYQLFPPLDSLALTVCWDVCVCVNMCMESVSFRVVCFLMALLFNCEKIDCCYCC